MSVYTPTPVENTSYTAAADGDNDNAAAFNVFLEGLADMVEWLRRGGSVQAHNWYALATTPNPHKRGTWNPVEATWFACGDGGADLLSRSQDGGKTWVDMVAALGSAITITDIAVKPSTGDMVLMCIGTRNLYTYAGGTYGSTTAYTQQVNALSGAPDAGAIDYEATAGKYIAIYRIGITGMFVDWDANGAGAWTAGTLPATWTGYTNNTQDPWITAIPGRAVAVFFDDVPGNNVYRTIRSTDGGATWSATNITPTSFNPATVSKPAYMASANAWFITGAKTAGARKTEVFRSTDGGATWTSRGDFTASDMALQDVQALGPLLVGVNDDGRIYYSADQGTSWTLATRNLITAAARPFLRVGGGAVCVWNSGDLTAAATLRFPGAA